MLEVGQAYIDREVCFLDDSSIQKNRLVPQALARLVGHFQIGMENSQRSINAGPL